MGGTGQAGVDPGAPQGSPAAPPAPPLSLRAWLRYDAITRALATTSPSTVLEVGCGQGALGARIARQHDYLGVEPDPTSYAVAERRITAAGGRVVNGTDADAPAGATYDLVCAFEVLEHIEDDRAALTSWVERIRPGGHLLLSVPAFQDRFGPMDAHVGHFRRYEPEGLRDLLRDVGLEPVDVTVYGWPLGYALESVRNRIDSGRLEQAQESGASTADLTAASGRTFQPEGRLTGAGVMVATLPFRLLQRAAPGRGIGLVALARRPAR